MAVLDCGKKKIEIFSLLIVQNDGVVYLKREKMLGNFVSKTACLTSQPLFKFSRFLYFMAIVHTKRDQSDYHHVTTVVNWLRIAPKWT